jgi:hypothetical protein
LQQLLEKNAAKLSVEKWERVIRSLIQLFKLTTPHQLYDEKLRMEINEPEQVDNGTSHNTSPDPKPSPPLRATTTHHPSRTLVADHDG